MQNKKQSSFRRRIGSLLATLVVAGVAVAAIYNAQFLRDTVYYYQYSPEETVASFVTTTGMSEYGKFLFYASQPVLQDAESFNQKCSTHNEKNTAVLGCYDGQTIYIYDITDPRLSGIRPTTAAHEMLHAAYKRLSSKERQRIDGLLEAEYEKLKDDQELSDRMAFYAVTQPGDRANELHSIIGTEVAVIGVELEEHYKRYFSDRSKVIAQHQQYRALFMELKNRAEVLIAEIDALGRVIQNKRAAYDAEASALQAAIADFNQRARQGEFESQAAFSAARAALMSRSVALEAVRTDINASIIRHDALIDELNGITVETNALNRSLDSNLAPVPSV